MAIIAKLRANILNPEINRLSTFYEAEISEADRLRMQLRLFNSNWEMMIKNVPFYKSLYLKGALPNKFESWDQFLLIMPITDRKKCIINKSLMTDISKNPDYWRTTGGSSGDPIQIPAWNSENKFTGPDQWVGRRWFGITPGDSCFWLMGNSRMLGSGLHRFLNKNKRAFKDVLLGYYRYPSYNLTPYNIGELTSRLLKMKPDYVIGFSTVLDLFARLNVDRHQEFKDLNIKAVIATSEVFPFEDSPQVIAKTFQAPVLMEYGSNETIAIAYTKPTGIYKVFWKNYFVEAADSGIDGYRDIRITSLYPRCFPLIRYELGDQIELIEQNNSSTFGIDKFKKVHGRKNNFIILKDGHYLHTRTFADAVRVYKEITGFQIIDNHDEIHLNLTTINSDLSNKTISEIQHRLSQIHPELKSVQIHKVNHLQQTINGKTPLIIKN